MLNSQSRFIENYLKLPKSDTKQPGNDFYQYINQKWLKQTKIPPSVSEFGASDEIEKENRKKIKEILDKCKDKQPAVGEIPKDAPEHIQFFQYVWKNSKRANEQAFIKLLINQILDCRDISDFSFLLGSFCKSGISVLFNLKIREEHRKPYFSRKTLIPGVLTLPDLYYFKKGDNHEKIWKAYEEYISTCAIELGIPYLTLAIDAEIELTKIFTKNDSTVYREVRGRELANIVPDFNWVEFMSGLSISNNWQQEFWILEDEICIKRLLHWFCRAEKEKVAALFTLRILNIYSEYLNLNIENAYLNLFQKEMRGISVKMSDETRFINNISSLLGFALCSEFSKMEYSVKKQKEIKDLVKKIKIAAVNTMSSNKSFSNSSTSRVIEKINRMKINIGTSDSDNLPKIPYYPESIIHTYISIIATKNTEIYKKSGHPSEKSKLTYPCFIVNASYYEETNEIVIPWGILHSPFFISNAPLGWNYGGIGATIAHEISHAFDIDGSKFNPQAQYRQWWTRKNTEHFKKRVHKMSKFFTKHKRFGRHLNGKKTLSENWADFGGIVIVLNALKQELKEQNASEEAIKKAMKILFISYAVSWRDKMRKKKVLYNIIKSVHSLAEDRVNLIVPHFQEWVDAFDIKESDPLFIPVGQRLKFL